MKNLKSRIQRYCWLAMCLGVPGLLGLSVDALAAITSIANQPLPTYVSTITKPNILFVLDNSGSMAWDYMPDDISSTSTYGYKAAQCNGVGYDPTFTYTPPLKDDGTVYPNATFTASTPNGYGPTVSNGQAYNSTSTVTTGLGSKTFTFTSGLLAGILNGFNFLGSLPSWSVGDVITAIDTADSNHWVIGTITSISNSGFLCPIISCTESVTINVTSFNGTASASNWAVNKLQYTDLTNSTYYNYTGTQTKMGWTYSASGLTSNTFSQECLSNVGSTPGKNVFTGVTVTAASSEAQNYANWYQYYRTRMLMVRSAAGRAFQPLTSNYRVGFSTISDTDTSESTLLSDISAGNAFLNVRDYDSTQRSLFMQRLYNTTPSGSTPLRNALSKAGQYFAKKVTGQTYDPMQYACQRNYAFLSTDGYWNDSSNPKQLDGSTAIGQQDAADVRPFSDGGSSTSTTVTTSTDRKETDTPVTVSQVYTRGTYTYGSYSSGGCFLAYPETGTPQVTTTSASGTQVVLTDWTTTTTVATTTTAGVQTSSTTVSGPTSSPVSTTNPTPAAPGTGATWTNSTPVTTACVSTKKTTPGSAALLGSPTITATGAATTVTLTNTTAGPTTTVAGGSGGTSNTLADVAEYYYQTDLRTTALGNCTGSLGTDVCDNSQLTASGSDTATWQHMTTFTMGLGVNGVLPYDQYYLNHATVTTSSYYQLLKGTLNWPAPVSNNVTTVDDLWHAAVNGRGQYFGVKNATDLTLGLNTALASMGRNPGAGAAVALSTGQPSGGSGLAFVPSYTTVDWTGNIQAYTVQADGTLSSTPLSGTAQSGVDNLAWRGTNTADGRTIYYRKPNTTTLSAFTYANLSADGLGTSFVNFCVTTVSDTAVTYPQQCTGLSAAQLLLVNSGTNLVNWLRGASAYEQSNASNPLFRTRLTSLGDIIGSEPVYLAAPPFSYTDAGYASFVSTNANRKAVVYAGANDGMLHAFSGAKADLGTELWAFVPTAVMSKMGRLADANYANNHQYYVDGSPVLGDISVGGVWKSILVGGFNAGGKGYYALDVTNPTSPKLLWEFTQALTASTTSTDSKDPDLGLTFGNPIITKRADGTWVVVFASGYNNTGNGYLYVLNANTGVQLAKIPTYTSGTTPAGTLTTPSGLARINAWLDAPTDNSAKRFYGGDLLGNLWRFDIDNLVAPNGKAQRLASFLIGSSSSTPQPITARPELSLVTYAGVKYPMVFVGTGRYLGVPDLTDATQQSIYAIKDPLTASDWGDVRANNAVIQQTVTTSGTSRTASANTVNLSAAGVAGWRLDLPTSLERIYINMDAHFGKLIAGSVIPGASTCSAAGGSGWLYVIDEASGSAPSGMTSIGTFFKTAPAGINVMVVNGVATVVVNDQQGSVSLNSGGPDANSAGGGVFKRASWRELITN